MVNKPNLVRLVDDFVRDVESVHEHWRKLHDLVANDLPARRAISEDCLSDVVQTWETFRSDWQLRAVVRDASQLFAHQQRRLEREAAKMIPKTYPRAVVSIDLGLPSHLTIEGAEKILDAHGQNLTYKSEEAHKDACVRQLALVYRRKALSVTADEWLVLDLARECRNAIAHRSPASVKRLNRALINVRDSGHAADALLGARKTPVTARGVGSYLYGSVGGGDPTARVIFIGERLQDIGRRFA